MSEHDAKIIVRMSTQLRKDVRIGAAISDCSMEEFCRAMIQDGFEKGEKHYTKVIQKQKQLAE